MKLPPRWKLKPSSHRITRIAKIVQSIKAFLEVGWVSGKVRMVNQDRFVLTSTEVSFEGMGAVVEGYGT
jgi:hypothetical protein